MCRPCRALLNMVCTASHPDWVGVGYDIPSLWDFRIMEIGNFKFDTSSPSQLIRIARRSVYLQTMGSK